MTSQGQVQASSVVKKSRIKSLEGLRAFAFFCIMFCHSGAAYNYLRSVGAMSVSLFFILSGFVSVYSQIDKTDYQPSFSYNFKYMVKHLKKLYPLLVVTTLAFFVFEFVGDRATVFSWIKLILNLLLIQEWIPVKNTSINGVAWFLCTMVLFYFVFPWVLNRIQNNCTKEKAKNTIVVLVLVEVAIYIATLFIPSPAYSEDMIWNYRIGYWFAYRFPLCRLVDCLIGCYLGYLFVVNKDKKIESATLKEGLAFAWCIISAFIATIVQPINPTAEEISHVYQNLGWTQALVYLPGTASIIYLFAFNQGKISRLFENRFFMYVADLSAFGFLIHYVVFDCIGKAINVLQARGVESLLLKHSSWINITVGVALTLSACQIWKWMMLKWQRKIRS